MTTLIEPVHTGEFILSECCEGSISREAITVVSGQNLVTGTVLGKITKGTIAVGTVTFAGTGNGTLTKATPAYGAGVQGGNYLATCIEKTTDSGLFEVIRPDGTSDGFAKVGIAYDGQVKFTIADGSTDFDQGAAFTIPVTIPTGSGKYKAYDPANTDGSEIAVGILYQATDATLADKSATGIMRLAEVIGSLLTGSDSAAVEQLKSATIIVR